MQAYKKDKVSLYQGDCMELDKDYYNDAVKRFKTQTLQVKTNFVKPIRKVKQTELFK